MNFDKCPFPWFGGKSKAASVVWNAIGDVHHYIEPFAGSLAVLLNRPHPINRQYHSETVNDLDGLLVNAWRSIQMSPEETADHASWPTSEADLMARHLSIISWVRDHQIEHLMGDPAWHDPKMAGWWLNGVCQWIGRNWCSGTGPWVVGNDKRITKKEGDEPGVYRQKPVLASDGKWLNALSIREGTPGNVRNGVSVWHPCAPDLTSTSLLSWFQHLAQRLRWVRILNGDWSRSVTKGAIQTLSLSMNMDCFAGIFLDPPYASTADRDPDLYAVDSKDVALKVAEWALENGDNPQWRIVLACYEGEHDFHEFEKKGWSSIEWFKKGFLSGGMGNLSKSGSNQQHRERLLLSPNCIKAKDVKAAATHVQSNLDMFGGSHP